MSQRRDSPGSLEQIFRAFGDREFVFVRVGGNWGDTLIHRGAEVLANRMGLRWRVVEEHELIVGHLPERCVVYLHGGGGFNSWCSGRALRLLVSALRSHAALVIQGPQTVEPNPTFLETFLETLRQHALTTSPSELILFVRELTSFSALVGHLPPWVDLRLEHDTAFNLTRDDLLGSSSRRRPRYDLVALREDNEALPGACTIDAPGVRLDPAYYAGSFDHWLRIHACSRSILTNRLHSSIAGAILGIPTTLLPGSYHKNRSVWEHSLAARGVKWLEWAAGESGSEEARPTSADRPWPLRYVLDSYKVQRTVMRLKGVPLS